MPRIGDIIRNPGPPFEIAIYMGMTFDGEERAYLLLPQEDGTFIQALYEEYSELDTGMYVIGQVPLLDLVKEARDRDDAKQDNRS